MRPLPTSMMELFVTIFVNWKLLTSAASSLDPQWLIYHFQRTEEGCLNMNSLVVCMDGGRPLFLFIPNTKCKQDFNKTFLETLSMPEKTLKMLLNISDKFQSCCWTSMRSTINFKEIILLFLFAQVIDNRDVLTLQNIRY